MYIIKRDTWLQKLNPDVTFVPELTLSRSLFSQEALDQTLITWCGEVFGNPSKVFLDVGAHLGFYSWGLASRFKHVHAFEPNPEVFNALCANVLVKNLSDQVTPHRFGLSDQTGLARYFVRSAVGLNNGFSHLGHDRDNGTPFKVRETKALDSLQFDNIGFIKLDVEHHELNVLVGAQDTLKRSDLPPIVFKSWSESHWTSDQFLLNEMRSDLFGFLDQLGYRVVPIQGYPEMFIAEKK